MSSTILNTGAYIAELSAIDKTTLPADGGQRFNRLIFARSPYLLQHSENPVDWYEWGPEAFDKARTENLPILLSIGYATCHWCHVMAHESFEDHEVAELLNSHFVCIKVDREERPDIDDFYMTVSQLMTGSGGWPLNIFMAPDQRPFMTITYLPKRGRGGMSGLMELLSNIATLWRQRPDMIEKNCRTIMQELGNLQHKDLSDKKLNVADCYDKAFNQLIKIYDTEFGGFGSAPKFPMPIYLGWLIGQKQNGNTRALEMALHTLRRIRNGGIWDQLAGGLHRYSVDQQWLAPHFEKMLYDQAMLTLVTIDAFQASGEPFFSEMAMDLITFVQQELSSPEGAFYSALDADSEGIEGQFYIWDKVEIDEYLGANSRLFCQYYDVSDKGNFEGSNILNMPQNLDEFCSTNALEPIETVRQLKQSRELLLQRRGERIRPLRDDKIITSWNGLMIAALARGGIVLQNPEYLDQASTAARFVLTALQRPDGRLLRSYLNGPSTTPAFLEDYAFLAFGLLELYEATLESVWLEQTSRLVGELLRLFRDPATGQFMLTGHDAEQMPARVSSDHDGVTPSALAVTARVLLRLAWIRDDSVLIEQASSALNSFEDQIRRAPLGHLAALQALAELEAEPVVVELSGPEGSPGLSALLSLLKQHTIPRLAIRRGASTGPSIVSICANRTCYPAVSTTEELKKLLQKIGL